MDLPMNDPPERGDRFTSFNTNIKLNKAQYPCCNSSWRKKNCYNVQVSINAKRFIRESLQKISIWLPKWSGGKLWHFWHLLGARLSYFWKHSRRYCVKFLAVPRGWMSYYRQLQMKWKSSFSHLPGDVTFLAASRGMNVYSGSSQSVDAIIMKAPIGGCNLSGSSQGDGHHFSAAPRWIKVFILAAPMRWMPFFWQHPGVDAIFQAAFKGMDVIFLADPIGWHSSF